MKLLISLFFFMLSSFAFSQIGIEGQIINQNNEPIEFAQILLLNKDSVLVKNEYSDEKGFFFLSVVAASYTFQIKQFHDIIYSNNINVYSDLNLGNVKIEVAVHLGEAVIEAKKKIIEVKADKLIYHVSNDVFNEGSNLLNALSRAPRIDVENESIRILGKDGNVKILIDGRLQTMTDEALKARLKGLRADQIEKIEIMPTPPARYDATGNGGMINIILKKDQNLGLQGNANAGLGVQFKKVSTDQGININYKVKRIDVALNVNRYDIKGANINRWIYDFDENSTITETFPDIGFKNSSINTVLQYKVSSKVNVGTTVDYINGKTNGNNLSSTSYYNKILQKNDSLMFSRNVNQDNSKSKALSLFSDYTIDSLGKKISLIYNYSKNNIYSNADNESNITIENEMRKVAFSNYGDNQYIINGVLLDIGLPFSFGTLEVGGAYTNINNMTAIEYYNEQNRIDINRSNRFEYTEKTSAGHFSFQKDWDKKWSSKMGLRLENTSIEGHSPTLLVTNTNNYTQLFPTVSLSYNPNIKNNIFITYSKRLNRPDFYDLNPFRYYTNTYNYTSGNPELLPTYTNALELSYIYNQNLNLTVYGNYIANGIAYITNINEDNSYATIPVNNYTQKKLGLISTYSIKPFRRITIYGNFNAYYTMLDSKISIKPIEGFGGNFNMRSTCTLNKSQTSLFEIIYRQVLPSQAQFLDLKSKGSGSCTAHFKQMLLNKDLILDLWISDIFRQNINTFEKQYNTYHYTQYSDIRNRGFYLTISYMFGNKNVNGVYKDTKNDDRYRGNK